MTTGEGVRNDKEGMARDDRKCEQVVALHILQPVGLLNLIKASAEACYN
jgi:hypothetical protein